jgi:hypothetical protein
MQHEQGRVTCIVGATIAHRVHRLFGVFAMMCGCLHFAALMQQQGRAHG